MSRVRIVVAVLALAVFGGWLLGDDPKKTDTFAKHTLPQGWKALGLSDEQKKKIYAIEDEYEPKITALKKQIEALQGEEKGKKYDILTAEQKKQLAQLREAKDSGGAKDDKKDDKNKKDEKKP